MCVDRGIWKISVPSTQFCCEPKNPLKNKVHLKKQKRLSPLCLLDNVQIPKHDLHSPS